MVSKTIPGSFGFSLKRRRYELFGASFIMRPAHVKPAGLIAEMPDLRFHKLSPDYRVCDRASKTEAHMASCLRSNAWGGLLSY